MLSYTMTPTDHCRTLDSFLGNLFPAASPSYRRKLLKSAHIRHNGSPANGADLLLSGDILTLKETTRALAHLASVPPLMDVLYEDEQLLIINKDPGLAVHSADKDRGKNLVVIAEQFLSDHQRPCNLRLVNRIDLGTSGAVILAKNTKIAGLLGRYIDETGLAKIYLAAVVGASAAQGLVEMPIDGKPSLTRYQRLYLGDQASIVAVFPVSGRKHQIRRHFADIAHPIIGDRRYGKAEAMLGAGHALHAFGVGFKHPITQVDLHFYAPLPPSLLTLFRQISGENFPALLTTLPGLVAIPRQIL